MTLSNTIKVVEKTDIKDGEKLILEGTQAMGVYTRGISLAVVVDMKQLVFTLL